MQWPRQESAWQVCVTASKARVVGAVRAPWLLPEVQGWGGVRVMKGEIPRGSINRYKDSGFQSGKSEAMAGF